MSEGAERSYLSIGEVLGLLLEEFPDVTISKIRFLESQGLIDPERTPAGYRKFYEADVELLRVILREQRENFLPLRVIKDRIDSGEIDASGEIEAPDQLSFDISPVPNDSSMARRPRADSAVVHTVSTTPETATMVEVQSVSESGTEADPVSNCSDVAAGTAPEGAAHSARSGGRADQAGESTETEGIVSGLVLDHAELCSMAQISAGELDDLVRFGLVVGRESGSATLYGEDAVEVARVCAEFLRAGVDARHLRGWRLAVDREITLYEQMVAPQLRQRSPAARAEVHTELQRLDRLGARLRSALMAQALSGHRPS